MDTPIRIHQALFGYDAGHHLLASSTPLSLEVRQELSIATDLSGSAPAFGFEDAVTGFPIQAANAYAFFVTWLAPEMARPGCVWTHVLLLDLADVGRVSDLGCLRSLFRRPFLATDTREYEAPIMFASAVATSTLAGSIVAASPIVPRVLSFLYGSDSQVVIVAQSSRQYEALLLALWSQQWSELRQSFRFSTGSFSDRSRGREPFDIQITPAANRKTWSVTNRNTKLIEADAKDSAILAGWLSRVVDDLYTPDESGFRTFLVENSVDIRPTRASFRKLARSFDQVASAEDWSEVLAGAATEFPDPSEAIHLKYRLLRPPARPGGNDRSWSALRFLLNSDAAISFGPLASQLNSLVFEFWTDRKQEILGLLLEQFNRTDARQWKPLALAVAPHLDSRDVAWFWRQNQDLFVALVRVRPELAAETDLWDLPQRAQWAVVEAIESSTIQPWTWRAIVVAMLRAGTRVGVREVVQAGGEATIGGAIDWVLARGTDLPSDWRDALAEVAQNRLQDRELPPADLAFVVSLLPPSVVEEISAGRPDVIQLASVPLRTLPEPFQLPAAFFLVTLGLISEASEGAYLLARGFVAVHTALADRNEPPNSWRLLQRHLPDLGWWDWDRCDKLREAAKAWLKKNPGYTSMFAEALSAEGDDDLVQRLVPRRR